MPDNAMATTLIVDIQRFCTHDGPGIRTTVFLKGCPLVCPWCQNPEARETDRELSFSRAACILCGRCVTACPRHAHRIAHDGHLLDRARCQRCFRCVGACRTGALEIVGRERTVADVLRDVVRDRVFYETSGGGITLSGGEPAASPDFSFALLSAARAEGIHTCIETSGYGTPEDVLKLSRVTDLFLWDIKITDRESHLLLTGVPWASIIDNLMAVDACGNSIILRCPCITEINMTREHLDSLASLATRLRNCKGIELIPYHAFGTAKAEKIGKRLTPYGAPERSALLSAQAYLRAKLHNTGT